MPGAAHRIKPGFTTPAVDLENHLCTRHHFHLVGGVRRHGKLFLCPERMVRAKEQGAEPHGYPVRGPAVCVVLGHYRVGAQPARLDQPVLAQHPILPEIPETARGDPPLQAGRQCAEPCGLSVAQRADCCDPVSQRPAERHRGAVAAEKVREIFHERSGAFPYLLSEFKPPGVCVAVMVEVEHLETPEIVIIVGAVAPVDKKTVARVPAQHPRHLLCDIVVVIGIAVAFEHRHGSCIEIPAVALVTHALHQGCEPVCQAFFLLGCEGVPVELGAVHDRLGDLVAECAVRPCGAPVSRVIRVRAPDNALEVGAVDRAAVAGNSVFAGGC